MRPAAVFEVDGTLIRGASAERLLVSWLVRAGVIGVDQLVAAAPFLLSGAPDFIVEAIGARLGVEGVVSTPVEVIGGRFTGRLAGTHCFGEAKRAALEALNDGHGIAKLADGDVAGKRLVLLLQRSQPCLPLAYPCTEFFTFGCSRGRRGGVAVGRRVEYIPPIYQEVEWL